VFGWRIWRWVWEADIHDWIGTVVVVGGLIWCAVWTRRWGNEIYATCGHTRDGHPDNPGIAGDHWFTKSTGFRILPMQLRVGDRLVDETAEWEIVDHPYTTNAGKTAHIRIRRVDQPEVAQIRSWGAHERIAVRRLQ